MAAITYGIARVPAAEAAETVQAAAACKSWFARFMDALIESRMQQAQREIARHVELMAYTFDERTNKFVKSDKDAMPLGGW